MALLLIGLTQISLTESSGFNHPSVIESPLRLRALLGAATYQWILKRIRHKTDVVFMGFPFMLKNNIILNMTKGIKLFITFIFYPRLALKKIII